MAAKKETEEFTHSKHVYSERFKSIDNDACAFLSVVGKHFFCSFAKLRIKRHLSLVTSAIRLTIWHIFWLSLLMMDIILIERWDKRKKPLTEFRFFLVRLCSINFLNSSALARWPNSWCNNSNQIQSVSIRNLLSTVF